MNSSIISPHLEVCLFKFQNDECKSCVSKSKLRWDKPKVCSPKKLTEPDKRTWILKIPSQTEKRIFAKYLGS